MNGLEGLFPAAFLVSLHHGAGQEGCSTNLHGLGETGPELEHQTNQHALTTRPGVLKLLVLWSP